MKKYYDQVMGTSGTAIAGATVTVRVANATPGTGALATIYSDDGITTIPGSVVTTDATGTFSFYAPDGRYDLVCAIAGFTKIVGDVEISDTTQANSGDSPAVFGTVIAAHHQSSSANIAASGQFQLAANDTINWRNNGNTADVSLSKNTNDQLVVAGFALQNLNNAVVVMADQFANVQAAISALPSTGGVVDARSAGVNLTLGALDTGSNTKPVTLLLGPFTYTFTQITVRQGFNILGAGVLNTILSNNGTNANPAFVIPQVNNNIITVNWRDFQVTALVGNTSQDGILFDASTLTNAGVQSSTFTNIIFTGFNGAGIHLKSTQNGVSGSVGAIQGNTFTNVQSIRPTGATGATQNALRIEGGCGQCDFWNCWFLGASNDTGTNVFVGTSSTQGAYSIHFHSCTVQNGFAYIIDGCNSITTENDHFENIKGCYNLATTSQLFAGLNFKTPFINSNVATNAGNGYVINLPNTVTSGDVTIDSPFMGNNNPDHLILNASSGASVRTINARTFNGASPTNVFASSGSTIALLPSATLDLKGFNNVQLSASATSITTLKSTLMPGEKVTFYASGGTAQFANGGNLTLANQVSPFVLQNGDSATFERVDAGTPAFILIAYTQTGKISVDLSAQTANIGTTTLYSVPASGAGWYRFIGYATLTQAATTSSTMVSLVSSWTDEDNGASQSVTNADANPGANILANSWLIANLVFRAKASTNITYQTTGYASTGATPMQYALHLKLEYLGP